MNTHDTHSPRTINVPRNLLIVFTLIMTTSCISDGQSWSNWESLGSPPSGLSSQIIVQKNQDGRLELFAIAGDGALWHTWQGQPNGHWGEWGSLGAPQDVPLQGAKETGRIAAGLNLNGELEVVAWGTDGSLWKISQSGKNGTSGWTSWVNLSVSRSHTGPPREGGYVQSKFTAPTTSVADVVIGRHGDGRLELMIKNEDDGQLWHTGQARNTPGVWGGEWIKMGSPGSKSFYGFINGRNRNGGQEVLAIGHDNDDHKTLWHISQNPDDTWGAWEPTENFPGPDIPNLFETTLGTNEDGRLEFFMYNPPSLWHTWQLSEAGSLLWSGNWDNFGQPRTAGTLTKLLAVTLNQAGRQDVFTLAGDPSWSGSYVYKPIRNIVLWHITQVAPNTGWGNWEVATLSPAPTGVAQLIAATNENKQIELFTVGFDPNLTGTVKGIWHIYQQSK